MEAGPGLVYMNRAVSSRFASSLAQPAVPHLSHLCHGARSLASCRRVQRDGDLLHVSGLCWFTGLCFSWSSLAAFSDAGVSLASNW